MSDSISALCPYKGLQPYTEADRAWFFGRDRDVQIVISNLYAAPLTIFYGASGVGKSSVLLAGAAPELRAESRTTVVVFRNWQDARFDLALKQAVSQGLARATGKEAKGDLNLPFDEFLAESARGLHDQIFFILDQFEEYFLYTTASADDSSFDAQFARAVNRREVRANFLLSMREDGLSKLDRFQGRIGNLLGNMLRLEHLDRQSAEDAICKPLAVHNQRLPAGQEPVTIEDGLVEVLLEQVKTGKVTLDQPGQGQSAATLQGATSETRIETPFLQLVLTRLWNEEMAAGSRRLQLGTLTRLGGTEKIAQTHLDKEMEQLNREERDAAARLFRFLVTPSGSKIAQDPGSLAAWAKMPEPQVTAILTRLSSDMRILRKMSSAEGQPDRYEIFHDVLAPAILGYVRKAEQAQAERRAAKKADELALEERRQLEVKQANALAKEQSDRALEKAAANRRLKMLLALVAVLAIVAIVAAVYVTKQRQIAEERRREVEQARQSEQDAILRERRVVSELLFDSDNFEQTLARFQGALQFSREEGNRIQEGITQANIGQLYFRAGRYKEAEQSYQAAQTILEQASPGSPYLATTLRELASVFSAQGKYEMAPQLFRRAREMLEKTLGPNSPDVAATLKDEATSYQQQDDFARAEPLFRQALEINQRVFGPNHQQSALGEAALAGFYFAQGKNAEAERLYRQAQTKLEQALGPNHPSVGDLLGNLASVYIAQGRYGEAQPLLERAFDIHDKTQNVFPLQTVRDGNALAVLYNELGRYNDAETLFKQTLPASEQLLGGEHPEVATILDNLAYTYRKLGKCAQAEPLLERALKIQEKAFGRESLDATYSLNNLADCSADLGRNAEAEQLYQRALKIRREKLGEEKEEVAYTLNGLASLQAKQGRTAEAEANFQRAVAIREKVLGANHPRLAETLENYAAFLRKANRAAEATPLETHARALRARPAR